MAGTAWAVAGMGAPAMAADLAAPVTFGSPDQPYGKRRAVTGADRAAIQRYRAKPPVFSTDFASAAALRAAFDFTTDDQTDLRSCRRPDAVQPSNVGARFITQVATDCRARWSTGSISTKATYGYGFFEVTMKIADIHGMNNAFRLTTQDHYEIDVSEVRYPSYSHIGLQYWPVSKAETHTGMGFGATFRENMAYGFHDYGLLWTADEMLFEIDGEPVAALLTDGAVRGRATIRLSAALADWAAGPVPAHPEGHGMVVKSLRITGE